MATITAPVSPNASSRAVDPDEALFAELMRTEGKAEIIHGRVVHFPMIGRLHSYAADGVVFSLRLFCRQHPGLGTPAGDGLAYRVDLPHRRSFGPDASFYQTSPHGMSFVDGAPVFAVEVRSEGDYGRAAERDMAAKRADYFAAGTLVIWDVDLRSPDVVRVFRDGDAETPAAVFRRGDLADAEPAVPGWTMPVDDLFPPNP